jgi:hypothetical protein
MVSMGIGVKFRFFSSVYNTPNMARKLAANRKAPAGHARDYATKSRRTGIDGAEWEIVKNKNGVKRWAPLRKMKKVEDRIYATIKKVLTQKPAAKPKAPPGYKIVNDEVKPRKLAANRKAPPGHARDYATHAREVGIDGNEWKIIKVKNGVKRWAPSK